MASKERKNEQAAPPGAYRLTDAQRRYLVLKRALDASLALILLVLLAAPLLAVAAAVKLSAPRQPALFRQKRVGRGGALFTLCKFRSMDAATGHVTGLGRFLRKTSLDELPQLWQVLCGSMSLVGPRPLVPEERDMHAMRRARGVYQLRPGITGLAQINGRDRLDDREKAAYDCQYMERLCFSEDLRILCATAGKVLRCEDVEQK